MDSWQIAVFAGCCILGSAVQSVSSFGFAVVLVALTPLFGADLREVVVLITVLVVPNIAIALWQVRSEVRLRPVAWLLAGVPLGTPFGLYLLAFGPEWLLRGALGLVLIGVTAEPFLRQRAGPRPESRLWAFVAGVASGALGAALSAGGPPVVLYFYGRQWSKQATKAAVTLAFAGTVSWRLIAYILQAPFTGRELLTAGLALRGVALWPAVIAGALLGEWAFGTIGQNGFRRAVAAMLIACGVYQLGVAAGAW
ncbi:MAG TPA: sulfite exporter TauE/SafE family protein [Planctomycetota bacterium]|nr:sulfite exporter TauE/SafE family protein [Planctomycetota bacterium]HRR79760.1 sulfite exporter TauE/SafE family protein [Planctomycetota bacterium]HRT96837.1 sulfite exporter TauE/SafE family protein [Planctomycetota bacterium]